MIGDFLKSQLAPEEPVDPVVALHRPASASDVIVRPPQGVPCTSLFNRFTVDDKPVLRNLAD